MKFGKYLAVLTFIWAAALAFQVSTGHPLDHDGQLALTALAAAQAIALFTTCTLVITLKKRNENGR